MQPRRDAPDTHCALCDAPIVVPEAIVKTGDVRDPEVAAICRACAALPHRERRRLRDAAMVRLLNDPRPEAPSVLALPAHLAHD